jgi:hypothetical protein
METFTVFSDPESYCSFPSIVPIEAGSLLVAFRRAGRDSVEAAKGTPTHHDPDSRIVIVASDDGGESWDARDPVTVELPDYGVNDPALTRLHDGELLLRFAAIEVLPESERDNLTGEPVAHREDLGLVSALQGNYICRSADEGRTWSDPQRIEAGELTLTASREPVVETSDGTLALSVYSCSPSEGERAWLLRSTDGGASWPETSLIAAGAASNGDDGANLNETAVLPLGGDRLLAMIRADGSYVIEGEHVPVGGVGELLRARSEDAGASWGAPSASGIWGQPAHLLRLADGRILCTYGVRKPPYAVRARLSSDDGESWDEETTLREGAPRWDMGYPASAQLPDGRVVTVYYWIAADASRVIEATRWEPPA